MKLELISIPTDTLALDGLWYAPDAPARGAAMILHGNCMNFYTGAPRFFPPHLAKLGLAALSFNRRGHDMVATTNSRAVTGGAFQMTKEAIADNRYAADWLQERGFVAPIVIGHSNGGMLAVQHVADHPETPALVLCPSRRPRHRATRQQGGPARRRPHRRGRGEGTRNGGERARR